MVINSDDELFPVGAVPPYTAGIPIVMVPPSFLDALDEATRLDTQSCATSTDADGGDTDDGKCGAVSVFEMSYTALPPPTKPAAGDEGTSAGGRARSGPADKVGLPRAALVAGGWAVVTVVVLLVVLLAHALCSSKPSATAATAAAAAAAAAAAPAAAAAATPSSPATPSIAPTTAPTSSLLVVLLGEVCILTLVVALNLGTFRLDMAGSDTVYNHREIDELVFSTLMDGETYSLSDADITWLGLARENYGSATSLFIHPPLFVWAGQALFAWFGLSPVAVVVVLRAVTVLFSGVIAWHLAASIGTAVPTVAALWTQLLLLVCPLCTLAGHKVWIDNALACAVAVAMFILLVGMDVVLPRAVYVTTDTNYLWFLSGDGATVSAKTAVAATQKALSPALAAKVAALGVVVGGVILNTKLTGLAALPGACALVAVRAGVSYGKRAAVVLAAVFAAGAVVSHVPWVVAYHHCTGLWMPNAWPSKELVTKNPFVARAVALPWHTYVSHLATASPAMCAGALAGAVAAVRAGVKWLRCPSSELSLLHAPTMELGALMAWPFCFFAGHMFLAALGAGTQLRFVLAALPGAAVAAGVAASMPSSHPLVQPLLALLVAFGACFSLVVALTYPIRADIIGDLFTVLEAVLDHPFHAASTREVYWEIQQFVGHFGVKLG